MDVKNFTKLKEQDKAKINNLYCFMEHVLREGEAEEYCSRNFSGEATRNIMCEQFIPFVKHLEMKADDYIDSMIRNCLGEEDLKHESQESSAE